MDYTQFFTATGRVRTWGTNDAAPDESIEGTAWVPGVYPADGFWFPKGEPVPRPAPIEPRLDGRRLDLGDLPIGTPCRVTMPEGDVVTFELDADGISFADPGVYVFSADPPLPWHPIRYARLEVPE